jgi:hypothetical protein
VITSQLPITAWYDIIVEPTFADAILHRIVSVRSDCPARLMEWVVVSTIDSGHLEVGDGGQEGSEEAALV